jgi:hypothetical protein
MGERTIFVDEFQDAASKDGDRLIIDKFTESVERSNRNYSAVYEKRLYLRQWGFKLNLESNTINIWAKESTRCTVDTILSF